jgi:hypothetical protein
MLLLKRFDLKLGLWDLALDPVLRSTVLDSLPIQDVPEQAVQTPAFAWKQAERKAQKATARREAARDAVGEVTAALQQKLASLGWRVDPALFPGPMCLPLTESLPTWPGDPGRPLVMLRMEVNKSSIRILVGHGLNNGGLDISGYIEKRREAFEAVAPLPGPPDRRLYVPLSAPLWTTGTGWGDTEADWLSTAKKIAEHTKRWVELLADFVALCQEVQRARFEHHRAVHQR